MSLLFLVFFTLTDICIAINGTDFGANGLYKEISLHLKGIKIPVFLPVIFFIKLKLCFK